MIVPRLCLSAPAKCRVQAYTPSTLTAICCWMSVAEASRNGPVLRRPALFTRTSTGPISAAILTAVRRTASSSETSHGNGWMPSPAACRSRSAFRPRIATCLPSRRSRRAISRPSPAPPPVTTATFASCAIETSLSLEDRRFPVDAPDRLQGFDYFTHGGAGANERDRDRQDVL